MINCRCRYGHLSRHDRHRNFSVRPACDCDGHVTPKDIDLSLGN